MIWIWISSFVELVPAHHKEIRCPFLILVLQFQGWFDNILQWSKESIFYNNQNVLFQLFGNLISRHHERSDCFPHTIFVTSASTPNSPIYQSDEDDGDDEENPTRCIFHQHFTRALFANIFEKSCPKHSPTKNLWVKYWQNWH